MFERIKAALFKPKRRPKELGDAHRPARGRYDAAQTNNDNAAHWAAADALTADQANSPGVRAILRNRSRYERANNGYLKSIVSKTAGYVVGTGPRLQLLLEDDAANSWVEGEFSAWAAAVGLSKKLRTLRKAKAVDGEAFALLKTDPSLETPVKLNLMPLEAERIADASMAEGLRDDHVDGIDLNGLGDPVRYSILRSLAPGFTYKSDIVDARWVIHWFDPDRPGQHRGVPEIGCALPLMSMMRRYTLATVQAAEAIANVAASIETDAPADGEAQPLVPMETVEMERGMATVLPDGWKLSQPKPEQPTATYAEFKHEGLAETGASEDMPYLVAAGDSSQHSYAGGRLDKQALFKAIEVQQFDLALEVLDARVFREWLAEARLIPNYLPAAVLSAIGLSGAVRMHRLPHKWFFDCEEHIDPVKDATADTERLGNGTATIPRIWAKAGADWEEELQSQARALGRTVKDLRDALFEKLYKSPARPAAAPAPSPDDEPPAGGRHGNNGNGRRTAARGRY